MSSSPSSAVAPWRDLFLSHLATMDPVEFTLATVRRAPPADEDDNKGEEEEGGNTQLSVSQSFFPRVRTCIYRGLWANLPVNPKNDAPINPPGVWESDFPTFTTDARMDKIEELWEGGIIPNLGTERGGRRTGLGPGSPTTTKVGEELWEEGLTAEKKRQNEKEKEGNNIKEDENKSGESRRGETHQTRKAGTKKTRGSGGGSAVEALFWARATGVQWRVRGRAYVLGPDVESSTEGREVRAVLESRMRRPASPPAYSSTEQKGEGEEEGEWSFTREVTAHFGNLSPAMRGSFRNPPPGRPLSENGDGLSLGQKVTDLEDPIARANFRVVVIIPDEVDQTDLSNPERGRRWIHTYIGGGRGWETAEVWP